MEQTIRVLGAKRHAYTKQFKCQLNCNDLRGAAPAPFPRRHKVDKFHESTVSTTPCLPKSDIVIITSRTLSQEALINKLMSKF